MPDGAAELGEDFPVGGGQGVLFLSVQQGDRNDSVVVNAASDKKASGEDFGAAQRLGQVKSPPPAGPTGNARAKASLLSGMVRD